MDFAIAVDINAPPDVVWQVMWDGERWRLTRDINQRYLGLEAAGLKKRSEQLVRE